MLTSMPQSFSIEPIIEQVNNMDYFKRLELNSPSGEFFNDPWKTKSEFKNTPLGNVLDSLGNIGQARLLSLESAESYTAHTDPDDRLHLAIITNPYSYLIDLTDDTLYHIPVNGRLWYMDTGKMHVAANWGPRARIHLNIRVLLPKYVEGRTSIKIKVVDGDYDWKQLAYNPLMAAINYQVKTGSVTGFRGINEKEVWLNVIEPNLFDNAIDEITKQGITLAVSR